MRKIKFKNKSHSVHDDLKKLPVCLLCKNKNKNKLNEILSKVLIMKQQSFHMQMPSSFKMLNVNVGLQYLFLPFCFSYNITITN